MTAWSGLGLLVLVGAGILLTGLPAFVVLIAVASLGALIGLASGVVPFSLLTALPGRLVNLLDNDLLQALPLYVLMGLLLDRLPIAQALFRSGLAVLPSSPSAPLVSGMGLGALLGPMNGSVGASVLGLSRVVAPRLVPTTMLGVERELVDHVLPGQRLLRAAAEPRLPLLEHAAVVERGAEMSRVIVRIGIVGIDYEFHLGRQRQHVRIPDRRFGERAQAPQVQQRDRLGLFVLRGLDGRDQFGAKSFRAQV